MGHSEMLLAVAGLKEDEIKKRTKELASGDWAGFSPSERLAFRFADKLTKEPAAVTDRDVRELVETVGQDRALDLIFQASWCNYMTRVADAFQLPLERDNVFAPPGKTGEKGGVNRR
jgi:alkylhydroperoxidase family enzyme